MNTDALWTNIRQGCEVSFETLYDKFQSRLNRYAVNLQKDRFLAEEIVNDMFFLLWKNRQSIFSEDDSLKNYLYRILHNMCLDVLKKNKTQKARTFIVVSAEGCMSLFEKYGVEDCFSEKIESDEIMAAIDKIVEKMPKQRRKILRLFRDNGVSNKEIAEQMRLTESTVRTHLQLARKEIENFSNSIRH